MVLRPITDDERALALQSLERVRNGTPTTSLVIGNGLAGIIRGTVWLPVTIVQWMLTLLDRREAAKRTARGRRELEKGVVVEYAGLVKRSGVAKDEREPHLPPDLFIRFANDDQVWVSNQDMLTFGLQNPPTESAKIVMLPETQIILSVDAR